MKEMEKDKLKAVFGTIKQDAPSMRFEYNLMQRIRAKQLKAVRRNNRIAIFSISGGVALMVLAPIAVFGILGIPLSTLFVEPEANFMKGWESMHIDPSVVSISIVCFVLLIADMLIRQRIKRKQEES